MGGRGGSSRVANNLGSATDQQKQTMTRAIRVTTQRDSHSQPVFTMNRDGTISMTFTVTETIQHVHNSKMQDPAKNDTYRRVTTRTGTIMPDGLLKWGPSSHVDTLIKRGKH